MANDVRPVVVGIDGSDAAVAAAVWAVDEAIERDVPLRLVYAVAEAPASSAPYEANDLAIQYGQSSLRAASSVIAGTEKTVKVETELRWGSPEKVLIAESRSAALVCVASVGIGWVAEKVLGSTAAAVSRDAACTVVVVRYAPAASSAEGSRWIVVGVDDRPGADELVYHALDEAHLRHASLLAVATWSSEIRGISYSDLDHRCQTWSQRHPEVHIHPSVTGGGLPEFLVEIKDRPVELAVISAADAHLLRQIIGPHHRPIVPYGECSVMIVR